MSISLIENFRALFYAPYYAAIEIKAYQSEGVDVEFVPMEGPGSGGQSVVNGAEAITWGGPMRVLRDHDQNPNSELVIFCEVVGKDPFHILGHKPRPDFKLSDLTKIRFASFVEPPTPWNCLQEDLRRAGIDPASLNRVLDQSIPNNIHAFESGEVDAIQILEPYAQIILNNNHGHIWFEGASRGPCSYTTFYAKRSFLDAREEEFRAMYKAITRTLHWVQEAPPEDIAKVIKPYFPDDDLAVLSAAIGRYKRSGLWNETPILNKVGLERLRAGLLSNNFIERKVSYDEVVDTRFDIVN